MSFIDHPTFDRMTARAQQVLIQADRDARTRDSAYLEPEQVLLSLLRETRLAGLVSGPRHAAAIHEVVERWLRHVPTRLIIGPRPLSGRLLRVLEQGALECERTQQQIGTEHLLAAIVLENNSVGAAALREAGIDADLIQLHLEECRQSGGWTTWLVHGIQSRSEEEVGVLLREVAEATMGLAPWHLDSYELRLNTAREIGHELNRRGGLDLMKKVLDSRVGPVPGQRTIDQFWNGIGEWRG
jgi:ATP-dependent Clp protease ATP-binding subunit ClpA